MTTSITQLAKSALDALRPDPVLTVSEWADLHRHLSSVESGEPGLWRTARTPYLREPMDRLSVTDFVEIVVVMFGSQTGKTSIGLNWTGYSIHHSPGPMLTVMPTVKPMAERYSKQRLAEMIRTTPALRDLVKEPRSRDSGNTVFSKEFPGGILIIAGANSAGNLASMPMQRIFLDEVDRYPKDVDQEGSPIELARRRTTTFKGRRKILITSTPTIKDSSAVESWYLQSDQRRYFVPCPHCKAMQTLEWSGIKWQDDDPSVAWYECESCGGRIENHHKEWMLPRGEWRATGEASGSVAGYHLSTLYAPHGWDSWGDLAREWVQAQGNTEDLKAFINTRLAETWEDRYNQEIDPTSLQARCERYDANERLPDGISVITAGVDVQDDRLEVEVVGWGPGFESWSLAYHIIPGDPIDVGVWDDLEQILMREYPTGQPGRPQRVAAACVDSGFRPQFVHDFCRPRQRRKIWAIKGDDGEREVWPAKVRKSEKFQGIFRRVGVSTGKRDVYGHLAKTTTGPGYCHFPTGREDFYFEMLTSEKLVRERDKWGRSRWKWALPKGRRNEALDCRVYAYAAVRGWILSGGRLGKVQVSVKINEPTQVEEQEKAPTVDTKHSKGDNTKRPKPKPKPRRGSWLGDTSNWLS